MKIATFNINGVNTRLDNLLRWLKASRPDVVCLQELKATQENFPAKALEAAGYSAVWRGESRWNGVALLSRYGPPEVTRTRLPGAPSDMQARYLEAAINGVLIASLYLPNGNPPPGPKFDYKLAWFERLWAHAQSLKALDAPVILAGDYNVVPTEADIYNSRSWKKNALLQPEVRAAYATLLSDGWTDALRERFSEAPIYTFWEYFRDSWTRNAGLRLDHLLLNAQATDRLIDAGVDAEIRGEDHASDHAPAWIALRD